jgi:hypothetical protein
MLGIAESSKAVKERKDMLRSAEMDVIPKVRCRGRAASVPWCWTWK